MKIRNFGSNQTVLELGNNEIFFSYETPVAAFISGIGYIKTETKYSSTTTKHVKSWLRKEGGFDRVKEVSQEDFDLIIA